MPFPLPPPADGVVYESRGCTGSGSVFVPYGSPPVAFLPSSGPFYVLVRPDSKLVERLDRLDTVDLLEPGTALEPAILLVRRLPRLPPRLPERVLAVVPVRPIVLQDDPPLIDTRCVPYDWQLSGADRVPRSSDAPLVYVVDGGLPASFGPGLCPTCDDLPHASMVASRIVDPVVGIAPQARLVDVDVVEGASGTTEGLRRGLKWIAETQPVGVVTISLAVVDENTHRELVFTDSESCALADPVLAKAVDDLVRQGFTVVAATGNSDHPDALGLPGCLPGVVSVSGHTAEGGPTGNRADQSFLDLVAPGLNLELANGEGYLCDGGTSFAAPGVAAAFALLSPSTPEKVLDALCLEAIDLPSHECGSAGAGPRLLSIDCAWKRLQGL